MYRIRLCFLLVGFFILLDAPAKAQCRLVMNPATSHLDCIWPIASSATNGLVYWDGTKLTSTATGGAGTLCLTSTNGAAPSFGACSGSAATAFSAITTSVNSSATMTLGTGATLTFSGTGILNANQINGTALSSLGTGILKNTTGTGVPSIAVAGDFPTLNQNTTGTAANVTGVVAEANGGTGANNVPGAAGHYLRSNGTHYLDSAIQSSDVPTLNQSTTGNAATATALATSPSQCAAGTFPLGINTAGNAQTCTKLPQVFFGTAAPGSVTGNLPGDIFSDTTNHNAYWCNAVSGTAAPACTSVAVGGWALLNGSGSGSPASPTLSFQFNNGGTFGALPISYVNCGGVNATLDTIAVSGASSTSVLYEFPTGGTCLLNAVSVSTPVHWEGNSVTLKHNTGDTGNMLTLAANAVVDNFIFDVNGQNITTGIQPGLIAVTSGADPEIKNSTCLNSGTTQTSVDCLFTYQSSVNFHDNSVQNTIVGCSQAQVWISTIPAGGVIRLDHNTIDGGNCNQIFSQFADITSQQFITNNIFTNALAQAGSTGSTGNAVDIFQSNGLATIQGNRFYNPQFSAVRLNESGTDSLHALVANNVVQSAGEVSLYCEFGCEDVNFIGNKVLDGDAGVECTNVSSRNNSAPCQITGNTFMNMKAYGVHIEQDSAVGNTFTNMPVGVEAFFSTPNLISMNNFTNVTVPVAADTGLTGVQQVGGNALSTVSSSTNWSVLAQVTPQGHQSFAMHTQADLAISNITQATQAALTFDSTTIPTVGAVYLLRNVYGMVQSDGLECTIAASPAPTATTATCSGLNSLGFTAYANGPYGSSGRAWGNLLYSAGTTPAFSLPAAVVGLQ